MRHDPMVHEWRKDGKYICLDGIPNALVRTAPVNGRYLWQFGSKYGYEESLYMAKEAVEAGAEFMGAMRRNPYL